LRAARHLDLPARADARNPAVNDQNRLIVARGGARPIDHTRVLERDDRRAHRHEGRDGRGQDILSRKQVGRKDENAGNGRHRSRTSAAAGPPGVVSHIVRIV